MNSCIHGDFSNTLGNFPFPCTNVLQTLGDKLQKYGIFNIIAIVLIEAKFKGQSLFKLEKMFKISKAKSGKLPPQ